MILKDFLKYVLGSLATAGAFSGVGLLLTQSYPTFLRQVVKTGNLKAVKLTINAKLNTSTEKDFEMALYTAVQEGNLNITKLLIDSGASLEIALYTAVQEGNLKLTQLLIDFGAKVNVVDDHYNTPLHIAAQYEHLSIAELLVDSGADVNVMNRNKHTPLHIVAMNGNLSIAQLLIQADSHVNPIYPIETPLYIAAWYGHLSIVQLLLQAGAHINPIHPIETPLHAAASGGHLLVTQLLLRWGANVNAVDFNQDTPLHHAACSGEPLVTQLLIDSGADLNALNILTEGFVPIDKGFKYLIRTILYYENTHPYHIRAIHRLIKLLSWYIYKTCTSSISLSAKNHAMILHYLKNTYQSFSKLRQADPLLSWIFSHLLECPSKVEFMKRILWKLEVADEKQKNDLIENMDFFFLQELPFNWHVFKERFSRNILKKLNDISQYRYAQKMKKEIFKEFDEETIKKLMNLTTMKNNLQYVNILNIIYARLMECYRHPVIKPFWIDHVMAFQYIDKNEKILRLAEKGNLDRAIPVTVQERNGDCIQHLDTILKLIQKIKSHLDNIIEQHYKKHK